VADTAVHPSDTPPSGLASPLSDFDRAGAAFLVRHGGRTRVEYARAVRSFLGWCASVDVEPLTARREQLEWWQRTLEEEGRSPATRALRLAAVSGLYAAALDLGLVDRNPADRVRRPRLRDDSPRAGLTDAQARGLLEAARAAGARDHAVACLLLLNGLRVSEIAALQRDSLAEVGGHRVVRVRRKGGRLQNIPLAPRTVAALQAHLEQAADGLAAESALFRDAAGQALDRFDIGRLVRRLARRAGIRTGSVCPHDCRHTFITAALDAGVTLHQVADDAGHADPRTTQRYDRARHRLDGAATYTLAARWAGESSGRARKSHLLAMSRCAAEPVKLGGTRDVRD
jgi:integrase/recombinase XerD